MRPITFWKRLSRPARRTILFTILLTVGSVCYHIVHPIVQTRALIDAVHQGDIKTVRELLESGADPNREKTETMFSDNECGPWTPVTTAVNEGQTPIARLMIKYGAKVNQRDRYDQTPLMWAIEKGSNDAIALLLTHGADVNPHIGDDTPLHIAVRTGDTNVVRQLLTAGADINGKASSGRTPLMESAYKVMQLLLQRGAAVDIADHDGDTALMVSAGEGSACECRLLLAHGADPQILSKERKTAYIIAKERHAIHDKQAKEYQEIEKRFPTRGDAGAKDRDRENKRQAIEDSKKSEAYLTVENLILANLPTASH